MIDRHAPQRSLAGRYAFHVGTITLVLLLASGASEMYFGYREAREQIARLQTVQADASAREIEQYLRTIEDGLRDATKLPWGQTGYGLAQKREEFYRLMVLIPAITELQDIDSQGREQLFVSKSEPDRLRSLAPYPDTTLLGVSATAPLQYGATFYRDGAEPFVHLAIADPGPNRSVTVASVNLRFLGDVVSGLRVGEKGQTYVVDASNHLIAHPRPTQVLRKLNLETFAPVQAARRAVASGSARMLDAVNSVDVEGHPVITTAARVRAPDWLVFVEQPRSEALQPALATLTRTMVLVALGGGLAVVASVLFARRMAAPIVDLRRATERIAAGDLGWNIKVSTGDEIEHLADDFNEMAHKLRQSYRGLEAKVAVRTAELSEARDKLQAQAREMKLLNAQLIEQLAELALRKEEAERASAAKTRFLAAASHDLRQPMHSIGLLVSVLHERLTDREQVTLADKVQFSVAVMENLFSSLLDISKLDAGTIRPEIESFEIDGILRQIEHAYGPQAVARGLTFKVMRSRAVVRSDPVLLERILGNLVANAIRYSRVGGVLIGCRSRGESLAMQVFDTGIGIPAEHLDDIFEEFFRLNAPGHDQTKGLGLGLSIVKRSADMLGHSLSVRSQVGRGSAFEIVVPRVDTLPVRRTLGYLDSTEREQLAGAFILIVDDDDENREALGALCSQWGCHVLTARSIDEALTKLEHHLRPPDLVITDYRLGLQSTGFEVIDRVRSLVAETVPAIVITADIVLGLQQRVAEAGATLLNKPTSADKLLRAAAAALKPKLVVPIDYTPAQ